MAVESICIFYSYIFVLYYISLIKLARPQKLVFKYECVWHRRHMDISEVTNFDYLLFFGRSDVTQ